jgi:MoxR-like ATPase
MEPENQPCQCREDMLLAGDPEPEGCTCHLDRQVAITQALAEAPEVEAKTKPKPVSAWLNVARVVIALPLLAAAIAVAISGLVPAVLATIVLLAVAAAPLLLVALAILVTGDLDTHPAKH